jgi:hypothetical protein
MSLPEIASARSAIRACRTSRQPPDMWRLEKLTAPGSADRVKVRYSGLSFVAHYWLDSMRAVHLGIRPDFAARRPDLACVVVRTFLAEAGIERRNSPQRTVDHPYAM